MKKYLKPISLILAVMVLMAAIAGCSDKAGDSGQNATPGTSANNTPGGTSGTQKTPETKAPETKAVAAETMAEKVVVSAPVDITNMNPFGVRNLSYDIMMPAVYEQMGSFDSFGGQFHGVLMESWEQKDEKTYVCKLYENIFDHDGNHLTADDVVFSCEKTWEIGELAETAVIESIKALDEYTVEYVWKGIPGVGAFEGLMSNMYIVTKAAYEAHDGMVTSPCGTGPYKFRDYVAGSAVSIEATGKYWQDKSKWAVPSQLANVKVIECQVIAETAQVAMALQTGSIDASGSVGSEDIPAFDEGGAYSANHGVYSFPQTSGPSLVFNMSEESPCSDINLRLAICYAIDQDGLRAFVNGGKNFPLAVFGGTTYSDYDEKWLESNFPYDPALAKEYLAKSSWDGTPLNVRYATGNALSEEITLAIRQYLEDIGIPIEITVLPIAQLLPSNNDPTAWDFTTSGFPNTTGYIVNSWSKYFDLNTLGKDVTKNFMHDEELQSMMETVMSVDGHTKENLDKVVQYWRDNAIVKGLLVTYDNVVYNSDLIEDVVLGQFNYIAPNAFTYKLS